jgi:2-oxoglutarate ferredoxin oxidoreductase subunit beta
MTVDLSKLLHEYLRHDKKFPHVWCPGCGNGIVLGALIRAIHSLELAKDEIVLTSGIGCSGRLPVYVDFNTLHTTHGRALCFATGVKLAKPELTVLAVMGDGDATAIGGNHFIHAARRNLDLTAIIINNQTYGMTGGQYSPTTPYGSSATTAMYGHIEHAFSIAELAVTAGASFVARGTVFHAAQLEQLIAQGIQRKGFSVIEVMSNCHIQFGRRNRMKDPVTMMKWLRDSAIPRSEAEGIAIDEMTGRFVIGILADRDKPNYIEEYEKIRKLARKTRSSAGKEDGSKTNFV